jgi:hypothetical protein
MCGVGGVGCGVEALLCDQIGNMVVCGVGGGGWGVEALYARSGIWSGPGLRPSKEGRETLGQLGQDELASGSCRVWGVGWGCTHAMIISAACVLTSRFAVSGANTKRPFAPK